MITWCIGLVACGTPDTLPVPGTGPAPANPPEPIAWTRPDPALTTVAQGAPDPWPAYTELAAAADGINVRSTPSVDGTVVRRVPLGATVRVLEPVGESETVVGRTDRWYRVTVADGSGTRIGGYAFGATLTPLVLDTDDGGRVVASFSPDRQPRLRYRTPAGALRARDLGDPGPGGTLTLTPQPRDFVAAALCRGGTCTTWLVTLTDHIGVLPATTDSSPPRFWILPDDRDAVQLQDAVWASRPDGSWAPADGSGLELASLQVAPTSLVPPLLLEAPWATEPATGDLTAVHHHIPCSRIGTIDGDAMFSCGWTRPDPEGHERWRSVRYRVDADGVWRPLPAVSSPLDDTTTERVHLALQALDRTVGDVDDRGVGGLVPVAIPHIDETGRLSLLHHHPPQEDALTDRREVVLLDHPAAGRVRVDRRADGSPGGRAWVIEPDESVRVYVWLPWAHGVEAAVRADAPPARWYATHVDCEGTVVRTNTVLTGISEGDPIPAGTVAGIAVSTLPDGHAAIDKALGDRADEAEGPQPALLVVRDPWKRWVGLVREDLRVPEDCASPP